MFYKYSHDSCNIVWCVSSVCFYVLSSSEAFRSSLPLLSSLPYACVLNWGAALLCFFYRERTKSSLEYLYRWSAEYFFTFTPNSYSQTIIRLHCLSTSLASPDSSGIDPFLCPPPLISRFKQRTREVQIREGPSENDGVLFDFRRIVSWRLELLLLARRRELSQATV